MKKFKLLFKIYVLIMLTAFLLFNATGCLGSTYYSVLKPDVPDVPVFRYDAGRNVRIRYNINNVRNADEYMITCSGENIELLSPAEYNTEQEGSYWLEFRAPEHGEGSLKVTLTASSNGEALILDGESCSQEVNSYLYFSSCDCGIFLSEYSATSPELAMAKARFDAYEITSADYYYIARNVNFEMDLKLMNAFGQIISDKFEHSCYAAPYVQAVHNYIFGISRGIEVPGLLIACIIFVLCYFFFRKLSRRGAH